MAPDDGRVVSNFVVQALAGAPITLYGDGRQTRSFCYVDDMVDALRRLMQSPEGFCGPVNLGNPDEISMLELAAMVRELTGSACAVEHAAAPVDDPARRRPDISLARSALDWEPRVSLGDGLRRTIAYFAGLADAA
jgi:UDP-glucuronate decarboxylase